MKLRIKPVRFNGLLVWECSHPLLDGPVGGTTPALAQAVAMFLLRFRK